MQLSVFTCNSRVCEYREKGGAQSAFQRCKKAQKHSRVLILVDGQVKLTNTVALCGSNYTVVRSYVPRGIHSIPFQTLFNSQHNPQMKKPPLLNTS